MAHYMDLMRLMRLICLVACVAVCRYDGEAEIFFGGRGNCVFQTGGHCFLHFSVRCGMSPMKTTKTPATPSKHTR